MPELILHHYPMSPFAEKIRMVLGLKGLAWRSVHIPPIMPKPDVVALTGGYRKTPILQIGADIYCDTALIASVLDQIQPEPALYPASAPLAGPLAQWADSTWFFCAAAWTMQPAGVVAILAGRAPDEMKAFGKDRAAAGFKRTPLAEAEAQLRQHLQAFERQLAVGGPWLLGAAVSIADFSVAHPLWFIRRAAPVAGILAPHAHVNAWLDRLAALGHGTSQAMDSADALAVAAAATAHAPTALEPEPGLAAGDAVSIAATDYGTDPVAGTLVGLNARESVLRRVDPRAGTLHVHFPRAGFQVKKDAAA